MTAAQDDSAHTDLILISEEQFLQDLREDVPGLAAVREAVERGDYEAAKAEYIEYFRSREISHPLLENWSEFEMNPDYNTLDADKLLAGHFWDGYNVYEVPEEGIDWRQCPLTCLTRLPILKHLWMAGYHTGEEKYLRFIVRHIGEYMEAWPMEEFIGQTTDGWVDDLTVARPWHSVMICHRVKRIGESLNLLRGYECVSDEELFRMLHRLYQECAWLRYHMNEWVDRRHNIGLCMIRGLSAASEVLSDFKATDEWMAYDREAAKGYIEDSFYPDGMCVELTQAYSRGTAASAQQLAYMMKDDPEVQELMPRMEAIIGWAVGVGKPTGRLPSFGDLHANSWAGAINMDMVEYLDIPWVQTVIEQTDGPKPPATVWPWPGMEAWGGLYAMRSDWTPEALYMCIDGGPWGTSHRHGDRLSFVLSAYGEDFIMDPISTKYRSNEPDAFISRQSAGFLHNTITINGVDEFCRDNPIPNEATEPLDNTWEHGDRYTLFVSDYPFEPVLNAHWERRVVFVDRSYWFLQDVVTAPDEGSCELEQNFQFARDIEIEFDGTTTIATAPNGAKLLIVPLDSSLQPQLTEGDKTPHISYWPNGEASAEKDSWNPDQPHGRGWIGHGHKLYPAPAVTYIGKVDVPATITLAIIPISPDGEVSVPEIGRTPGEDAMTWRLPTGDGDLRVTTSVGSCTVAE